MSGNGHNPTEDNRPNGVQKITFTYDHNSGKINVDVDARSLDEALSIVQRGALQLECRVRFSLAQQFARENIENARLAGIAANVASGKVGRV